MCERLRQGERSPETRKGAFRNSRNEGLCKNLICILRLREHRPPGEKGNLIRNAEMSPMRETIAPTPILTLKDGCSGRPSSRLHHKRSVMFVVFISAIFICSLKNAHPLKWKRVYPQIQTWKGAWCCSCLVMENGSNRVW